MNKTKTQEIKNYQRNAGSRQKREFIADIVGWFGAVNSGLNSVNSIEQQRENHRQFLKMGDAIQKLAMVEQVTGEAVDITVNVLRVIIQAISEDLNLTTREERCYRMQAALTRDIIIAIRDLHNGMLGGAWKTGGDTEIGTNGIPCMSPISR